MNKLIFILILLFASNLFSAVSKEYNRKNSSHISFGESIGNFQNEKPNNLSSYLNLKFDYILPFWKKFDLISEFSSLYRFDSGFKIDIQFNQSEYRNYIGFGIRYNYATLKRNNISLVKNYFFSTLLFRHESLRYPDYFSNDSLSAYSSEGFGASLGLCTEILATKHLSVCTRLSYNFGNNFNRGGIKIQTKGEGQTFQPASRFSNVVFSMDLSIDLQSFNIFQKDTDLHKEIIQLNSKLVSKDSLIQSQSDNIQNLIEQNSTLHKVYDDSLLEVRELKEENKLLQNTITACQQILVYKDSTIAELQKRMNFPVEQNQGSLSLLRNERNFLKAENERLKKQLENLSNSTKQIVQKIYTRGSINKAVLKNSFYLKFYIEFNNETPDMELFEIEVAPSIYDIYNGRTIWQTKN